MTEIHQDWERTTYDPLKYNEQFHPYCFNLSRTNYQNILAHRGSIGGFIYLCLSMNHGPFSLFHHSVCPLPLQWLMLLSVQWL